MLADVLIAAASCRRGTGCAFGVTTSSCQALTGAGTNCNTSFICQTGLYCTYLTNGTGVSRSDWCASQYCNMGAGICDTQSVDDRYCQAG